MLGGGCEDGYLLKGLRDLVRESLHILCVFFLKVVPSSPPVFRFFMRHPSSGQPLFTWGSFKSCALTTAKIHTRAVFFALTLDLQGGRRSLLAFIATPVSYVHASVNAVDRLHPFN